MEPVLKVKSLSKVFHQRGKKAFTVVDHVSFDLYPGEILGIVGESGSGKSTIAKLVSRLLDATEGEIILDGQNITHLKGSALRDAYSKLQMVFQTPVGSFDPRKTLGNGVGESLQNKGISKAEVKEAVTQLLSQCGLDAEFASRYPHQVSGGQCQRAAIARALAVEPQVIICDEATSSLDVTVQKQIMDLLQSLKEEKNIACLFICHNLALVQQFCDRVLVLQDGKIVEQGTPDEVILHPRSEYTKMLVDSIF
ncbi:MAG: ABC transporter ATP-binding protein [Clostridiales bacterium]|nr:ABC transporter ATP-binding protein [Clostridiales bacterium]